LGIDSAEIKGNQKAIAIKAIAIKARDALSAKILHHTITLRNVKRAIVGKYLFGRRMYK
jgi:hypothetical protein